MDFKPGLEGVVVAETAISDSNGEAGTLTIRGYPIEELAERASYEEAVWLVWNGSRPDEAQREELKTQLAGMRMLEPITSQVLHAAATAGTSPIDALRMAAGTIASHEDRVDAKSLLAKFATIVATGERLRSGLKPLEPRPDLGHAANFLWMLTGIEPTPEQVRALTTYWITVIDNGLNASTFTARVIASTGSDLVSACTGAIGSLKGPLHGGAPGPALDTVLEIGRLDRAEQVLRGKLERGERLMGFGHRVYKVKDPRSAVLRQATKALYSARDDHALYDLATGVEQIAERLLEEHKPGRRLQTNVEFYAALLMHGLGLPADMFTCLFATSRIAGWTAHAIEQRTGNRIFRPASRYTGPTGLTWN
jgi:citrate synthase